jgi:hypothetical protein
MFVLKKSMSSHRGKYDAQVFMNKIFLERFVKIGDCARITFGTTLKIAGKPGFLVFCKPHNYHKILSNPKVIVIL